MYVGHTLSYTGEKSPVYFFVYGGNIYVQKSLFG